MDEYVPSIKECTNITNLKLISVIDVILSHKGSPRYGINIKYKKSLTKDKIKKLKNAGVDNLIEIDCEWILKQKKIPKNIEYKKLI